MKPHSRTHEIDRLIPLFAKEAEAFHDIAFYTLLHHKGKPFDPAWGHRKDNHAIILWQFYGKLDGEDDIDQFAHAIETRDSNWSIPGCGITLYGGIVGDKFDLFVRMAIRAGSLLTKDEATRLHRRMNDALIHSPLNREKPGLPVMVANDNPMSIWLNYLLDYVHRLFPGRDRSTRIEPDPFALSLLALEDLKRSDRDEGSTQSNRKSITSRRFEVALSFPGEKRNYAEKAALALLQLLGENTVFYDNFYQSDLAQPNLDLILQNIYRNQSKLLIVFICEEYEKKEWCGLEFRVVRDIIKSREDSRILFVRLDDASVSGFLSIDGYIDARRFSPEQIAEFASERLATFSFE